MYRTGLFLLAALLVAASARDPYRIEWQPHRFADCNTASLFAVEHPTVGEYRYRLRGTLSRVSVEAVPSLGFRGTALISYTLKAGDSVMLLPRWTWPDMTAAQNGVLRDFLDALRNHELGHREIAERVLQQQSTITVIGRSRREIQLAFQSALARQLHDEYLQIVQTEKTYDRVTGHGVRQGDGAAYGFRGGPNVTFSCPA